MKILLIEDEKALSDTVLTYLRQEGYLCEWAGDYRTARKKILVYDYDCIVVDLTLPGGDGLDLVAELKRQRTTAGIVIVSARNALEDRITGLETGSDDYLTKPFHLSELNARIKSIIRRRNFQGNAAIVFHEIEVLPDQATVTVQRRPVSLTRKEYDLLLYFLANQDRVLTKESIVEHLWGDYADGLDSFDFLYTHIKNLRKKLVEKGSRDYIASVYGVGYKFAAP